MFFRVSQDMMMMMSDSKSNISGWSLDKGYKDQADNETIPIRVFGSSKNSLDVALRELPTSDTLCSKIYTLIALTVSMPGENILPYFINTVTGRK